MDKRIEQNRATVDSSRRAPIPSSVKHPLVTSGLPFSLQHPIVTGRPPLPPNSTRRRAPVKNKYKPPPGYDAGWGIPKRSISPDILHLIKGHSMEMFIGRIKSFDMLMEIVKTRSVMPPYKRIRGVPRPKGKRLCPENIKKLSLINQTLTSLKGMSQFEAAEEVWVTCCKIEDPDLSEFGGHEPLKKLYLMWNKMDYLEIPPFKNLKILSIAKNNISSLSFLRHGLESLKELNVAKNDITCIEDDDFAKCPNLIKLVLSDNPLCTLQDVISLKGHTKLRNLRFDDVLFGSCPLSHLKDSRALLVSALSNIKTLNRKNILLKEIKDIKNYVNNRSEQYYTNMIQNVSAHAAQRKQLVDAINGKLEDTRNRLLELISMTALYRRILGQISGNNNCPNLHNTLTDHLSKMENRETKLRKLATVFLKHVDTELQISLWEQEVSKWAKWTEFQSFENIVCNAIHSVHGPLVPNSEALMENMHQLVSALACANLWPNGKLINIESVIAIRDEGLEMGMEKSYYRYVAQNLIAPYVRPGKEYDPFLVYGIPKSKKPRTFTDPNYKNPQLAHEFPDSVPGLPDKCSPLFMFLIYPTDTTPLAYLNHILTDKSCNYKDIRVTNCLWSTVSVPNEQGYFVAIVLKVVPQFLHVNQCNRRSCPHAWDCTTFSLKKPHSFVPAYILNISYTPDKDKDLHKDHTMNDEDILRPARAAISGTLCEIGNYRLPLSARLLSRRCPYLRKVRDGIEADLRALKTNVNGHDEDENTHEPPFEITSLRNLIGRDVTVYLTSLNLSGNRIGMCIGLEGLNSLKKLDLSHNNMTTLSGLQKLPKLQELKVGWNYLRFFNSNVFTLANTTPNLLVLDILPNTFQDVKELSHIPVLLKRSITSLKRVDFWTFPLKQNISKSSVLPIDTAVIDSRFSRISHIHTDLLWGSVIFVYGKFSNACLTDLEEFPTGLPSFNEGFRDQGIDLNLSLNYLTSSALVSSYLIKSENWCSSLVKLQLQENLITSLDWLNECIFVNVLILNLSNNGITELSSIPDSFPSLLHLHLCENPLTSDPSVLAPLQNAPNLACLDCSNSPLSAHPDYAACVSQFLQSVLLLDGLPITKWMIKESVERLGGNFSKDWFNVNSLNQSVEDLHQLTLPYFGFHSVTLPSKVIPKMMNLKLTNNKLSNLSSLGALARLRVLYVSHNCISEPEPTSRSDIKPIIKKSPRPNPGEKPARRRVIRYVTQPRPTTPPPLPNPPVFEKKEIHPRLQVLIMEHNGLDGENHMDLHSLPHLQSVVYECNKMASSSDNELNIVPTMTALVLDFNYIGKTLYNSYNGSKTLRYLHLEHNRIAALPRLPHLTNLTSLFLSHKKMKYLTSPYNIFPELTLVRDPIIPRNDSRTMTAEVLPQIKSSEEVNVTSEKKPVKQNVCKDLVPTSSKEKTGIAGPSTVPKETPTKLPISQKLPQPFTNSLIIRPLTPHLATSSPRSIQLAVPKPNKRHSK